MNYPKINDKTKAKIWEMITESERIFITSHQSPDGDSIASALGLYTGIKTLHPEKNVKIVYSNEPVPFFAQFENYDKIEFVTECTDEIKDSDLLVLLDAGQWSRASKKPEAFFLDSAETSDTTIDNGAKRKTLCIDHHVSKPDEFTLSIIDTASPSAAQLIYKLLEPEQITESLAKTLLIGILGDTGNLSYVRPDQGETFTIVQKLLEICNMSMDQFQSQFAGMSKLEFQTLQEYIRNMQFAEVAGYKPFTWSCITPTYVSEHRLDDSIITAAKNIFTAMFIKSIKGYTWGFTISPKPDSSTSVSFRSVSQGENVRVIAESLGGGGHDAAAGSKFKDISDPQKAFEAVIQKMKELKA